MNSEKIAVAKTFAEHSQPPQNGDNASFLPTLIDRELARGRMSVSGNYAPAPKDGRPAPKLIGDDPAILAKLSHVLRPKERLTQFYARTGLGLDQIRNFSRDEISRFVEIAATHERPSL